MHPSAAVDTELMAVPILMDVVMAAVKAAVMAVPILKAAVLVAMTVMAVPTLKAAVLVAVKDVPMLKVLMMAMDWIETLRCRHHKHNMLYSQCGLHSHNKSHKQHIYNHHTCKV